MTTTTAAMMTQTRSPMKTSTTHSMQCLILVGARSGGLAAAAIRLMKTVLANDTGSDTIQQLGLTLINSFCFFADKALQKGQLLVFTQWQSIKHMALVEGERLLNDGEGRRCGHLFICLK